MLTQFLNTLCRVVLEQAHEHLDARCAQATGHAELERYQARQARPQPCLALLAASAIR